MPPPLQPRDIKKDDDSSVTESESGLKDDTPDDLQIGLDTVQGGEKSPTYYPRVIVFRFAQPKDKTLCLPTDEVVVKFLPETPPGRTGDSETRRERLPFSLQR